jgi:hypothetical protein
VEAHELLLEIRNTAISLRKELDLVRVLWLEGKITAGLGRKGEARSAFEQVRQDFTTRSMPYDCALASLDLAVLNLEEGRTTEVRGMAEEMAWIFKAQDIQREVLAVLDLFCRAAKQNVATVELARRIARYLRKAMHDPELRFDE